jgi:hypothetical protein
MAKLLKELIKGNTQPQRKIRNTDEQYNTIF